MKRQYQKGYAAGQQSKAIKKAEPSDIVQDTKQHFLRSNSSTTAAQIHINNGTGTVSFRISNL